MIKLNPKEVEQIRSAVQEAESHTSGEIATAMIRQSDDYAVYELMFALLTGLIYFIVVLVFHHAIEQTIERMFWDYSTIYLVMFYGFSTFLIITLAYFLANIPVLDRLLIPKRIMVREVRARALRHFIESGICDTRDRTGILIFISLLERRVELIADRGINEKIAAEDWQKILQDIIIGIKKGRLTEHLVSAIRQCGDFLQQHFPIQPDDTNELKDDIEILER